ncbi:alpha-galactosidase [Paenibacillus humicola]|uniref:family 4 glycosyl hydrolase n=1 Tax=Paenibacillus humicola TaxID=3110540 RepID=UPI00237AA693|nr:alpha-galactosidase [Paenibacillus humicola]
MTSSKRLKITLIGAGSLSFAPLTIRDILLSGPIAEAGPELCLMDISAGALAHSEAYAREVAQKLGCSPAITSTTELETSLAGADFVITAIEKNRYFYWSQDFHVPRKYGFKQIFGENGGPGGMFHTLRNLPPMLEIARAMERICPDAWLINFTNPEAKIVEAIARLTSVKCVGLCHGIGMGMEQISRILRIPEEELETAACGLNHFAWFQSIRRKGTGEDLYPLLKANERNIPWLAHWDEIALSRVMLRTYGLYPYPGTNHIGEYIRWSEEFLAGTRLQYFYDPQTENPWKEGPVPEFVYSIARLEEKPMFVEPEAQGEVHKPFSLDEADLKPSHEQAVPIVEAIAFGQRRDGLTVNVPNRGSIPGLPEDMVVEVPAYADGGGIHAKTMEPLPEAITEMIRVQGAIHKLVIEAYTEQSRNKLLQAVLLDPTVSTYNNAIAMINEMCELQKDILPPLQ